MYYFLNNSLTKCLGKLKVKLAANGNLLPEDSSDDSICSLTGEDSDDYCQLAGMLFYKCYN